MNLERMKKLLVALLEHRDNGIIFEMNYWRREFKDEHSCKTACCAVGLYITRYPQDNLFIENKQFPAYHGFWGFTALSIFFDITIDEAIELFDPCKYKCPVIVKTIVNKEVAVHDIPITAVIKRVEDLIMKFSVENK